MEKITATKFYNIVTKEDIEDAIDYIIDNSVELKPSTRFNFQRENGELYPPKDILRYAAQLKNIEIDENGFTGGQANKPFIRLGYPIINKDEYANNINISNLSSYWSKYKLYFKLPTSEHQEKYKWPVLKQVYDKWDWNAEDKVEMFENAFKVKGATNLWMSGNFYPIVLTNMMFASFRDETLAMFNNLFNEKLPLLDRIDSFLTFYNAKLPELQKLSPDKKIAFHSHNDLRAISLYLSLQYPEKYFLFKYGMVKSFCDKLDITRIKQGDKNNLTKYYQIANEVLAFIKKDEIFLDEYRAFTNEEINYNDDHLHLITQDFIYSISSDYLDSKIKYWLYAPGENAEMWEDFYNEGIIGIGWYALGDLAQYKTKKDIEIKLQEIEETKSSKKNDATANFEFKNVLAIGDIIFAKKGRSQLLGYGEVTSDYYFDDTKAHYKSCRKIDWKKKGNWTTDHSLALKTLTDITKYKTDKANYTFYWERLMGIINEEKTNSQDIMNHPLNTILYGPPGTGKTYKTKELAIEIIDGKDYSDNLREDVLLRYEELCKTKQIHFTTFHQSISYEDFIEGIKPETINDNVIYNVQNGIFKNICELAGFKNDSNFEQVYQKLIEELYSKENEYLALSTKRGSQFHINVNSNGNLNLYTSSDKNKQGTITKSNLFKHLNGEEGLRGWEGYANGILDYLKDTLSLNIQKDVKQKNYVLIIDEINRGNISSIFGELITLIEEDKRKGNKEAIEAILPYSKEILSVPSNLYIIGTMNTADRSVEALDTALRRRFSFTEMEPCTKTLIEVHKTNGIISIESSEVNLEQLLKTINKRIEILVDKDHKIGHSYFINVETFDELKSVFKNKVIPLLKEYFFGDFGKIGLVLGDAFVFPIENKNKIDFAKNFKYDDKEALRDKSVYKFTNSDDWTTASFISIYSKSEPSSE